MRIPSSKNQVNKQKMRFKGSAWKTAKEKDPTAVRVWNGIFRILPVLVYVLMMIVIAVIGFSGA